MYLLLEFLFVQHLLDSGFYSEAPKDFLPDDMCATSEWTGWSECSTTCGKGYELRTRRFLNRMGRKKCPHVETMDRRNCAGSVPTCPEPEEASRIMASPDCAVTSWSEWSPCSVSCGMFFDLEEYVFCIVSAFCVNVRD